MSEAKNDLTRELIERFGPELGLDPAGLNHLWQRLSGDKDFGLWLCRQKILSASGNALLNAAANGIEGLLEDPKRLFQDSETIANSLAALRLNSESPPDVKVARPSEPESVAETEEAWLAAIPTDPKAASPPEHEPEEAWLAAIEVLRTPAQDSIKERSLGTSDLQEADSPRRSDGSFLDAVYESIRDSQLNSSRGASGRSTIVSAKTAPPSESMPDSSIEKDSIQGPSDKKYHEPDESPPEEAWLAAITTTRSNPSSSLTRGALSYDKLYDPLKDESKARLRETPAVPESARKDGDFPTQSALPESANAQDPSMSTLLNAWDQGAGLESAGAGIEASGLASAPTVRQESGPAVAVTGQVPAPGRAPVSEAASELISAPFSPSDTDKFLRELPSGTILGRTSLKHIIGAGGMSLVFLADHLALQVPVVVKILKPSQRIKNERFYQQFIAEARLAAHIDDPAFVRIFDCGYERGLAFIVLELIDGEPLNEAWGRRDLREPRKNRRTDSQGRSELGHGAPPQHCSPRCQAAQLLLDPLW
jgi:hypothetical protein